MPTKQQDLAFPNKLEHLHLYFSYQPLVTLVLDRINMAALKFLAVPEYHIHCGEMIFAFNDIVQQSENQLDSIRIVRAWDFGETHLANLQPFQNIYILEDLVLGTHKELYYTCYLDDWKYHLPEPTLSDYLYGFAAFYSPRKIGTWGETIKRIRIDHIDIVPELKVTTLSESFRRNVKILMLQPSPQE